MGQPFVRFPGHPFSPSILRRGYTEVLCLGLKARYVVHNLSLAMYTCPQSFPQAFFGILSFSLWEVLEPSYVSLELTSRIEDE